MLSSPRQRSVSDHSTVIIKSIEEDDQPEQLIDRTHIPYLYRNDDLSWHARNQARNIPPAPNHHYPPELSRTSSSQDSVNVSSQTSCLAAANIIAGLYGDQDAAKALLELGCAGTGDCLVKNDKVFQLMDGAV